MGRVSDRRTPRERGAPMRRKPRAPPAPRKAPSRRTPRSGDTVNLTRSGVLLSKLEELVQSVPVVDADRVRAVKEALTAGTYEVDDQAVADNMIRLDRELVA